MKIKRNLKGSAGKTVVIVIAIFAIVAGIAYLLLNYFGLWPFGKGKGNGEGNGKAAVAAVDSQEAEPAMTSEVVYNDIEVVVSGDKYTYNGGEYELDALIEEIGKVEAENIRVVISENNGLADALDALKSRLESDGIEYDDTQVK